MCICTVYVPMNGCEPTCGCWKQNLDAYLLDYLPPYPLFKKAEQDHTLILQRWVCSLVPKSNSSKPSLHSDPKPVAMYTHSPPDISIYIIKNIKNLRKRKLGRECAWVISYVCMVIVITWTLTVLRHCRLGLGLPIAGIFIGYMGYHTQPIYRFL